MHKRQNKQKNQKMDNIQAMDVCLMFRQGRTGWAPLRQHVRVCFGSYAWHTYEMAVINWNISTNIQLAVTGDTIVFKFAKICAKRDLCHWGRLEMRFFMEMTEMSHTKCADRSPTVHRPFTDCLPTVWYMTKKNPKYTQNSKNQRKMVTFYTKSRKTWLCPQFVHIFVCLLGGAVIQWRIHVNLQNGACHVLCDQHQCAFHSLLLANVGSYCNMAKTTHNLVRDEHKTELAMRGSYGVV